MKEYIGTALLLTSFLLMIHLLFKNEQESSKPNMHPAKPSKLIPKKTLKELHDLIIKQIVELQEEGDCEKKKVLICRNLENYAGFGSNVHRYGACMQVAYGLGRMFFIQQDEYNHFDGVFHWLKPESQKCGYLKKKYLNNYSKICNIQNPSCYLSNGYDVDNTHQVMEFNTKGRYPYPRHIPGTIPKSLEEDLLRIGVKHPWMWFTSQFLGFLLLRRTPQFDEMFQKLKSKIGFSSPIVGFHVRHGDKIRKGEATYVNETVYVKGAEKFFREMKTNLKRIYIATDDIPVVKIVQKYCPDCHISTLPTEYLSNGLGNYFSSNFPKEIIESVMIDLHFLANTDFLVCDFSSNLCRLAYELKQSLPPFKQESILHHVININQIYYTWWYHSYPSSLYITINSHPFPEGVRKNETVFEIIDYNIELFFLKENFHNWTASSLVLAQRLHSKGIRDIGYVYTKDLLPWPGSPLYHFTMNN